MCSKLTMFALTIDVIIQGISSQYYGNSYYQNMAQSYYPQMNQPAMQQMPPVMAQMPPQQEEESVEYDDEDPRRSRSGKRKYGSSGGKLPAFDTYDDYDAPRNGYDAPHNAMPGIPNMNPAMPGLNPGPPNLSPGPPNLVLVPYPYALVVPNGQKNATTPATTTITTTMSTTTALASSNEVSNGEYRSKSLRSQPHVSWNSKLGDRYMVTAVRKTKPAWVPKYGIVPIPDHLAEKLMSQLREVKGLQAQRN